MGLSSHEETDIRKPDLNNYVNHVYKQLKNREYRVKASTNNFKCPFCVEKKRQDYLYHDLLEHAKGRCKSYRSENLRQKGNHIALLDYLEKYHRPRMSSKPSEKSESHVRHDKTEQTDISESELDDYVYNVYKQLKNGEYRVKVSTGNFKCPFCVGKKVQEFLHNDLLQHAREMVKNYKSENLRQKWNHLALMDYLDKHHCPRMSSKPSEIRVSLKPSETSVLSKPSETRVSSKPSETRVSSKPSEKSESHARHDKSEKFVWPWKGIIANIHVEKKGDKYVGDSGSKLKDELAKKGFNPLKIIPLLVLVMQCHLKSPLHQSTMVS